MHLRSYMYVYKILYFFSQEDAGVGQKECSVCFEQAMADTFSCLTCGHIFCKNCWDLYFQIQIKQGITTGLLQFQIHVFVRLFQIYFFDVRFFGEEVNILIDFKRYCRKVVDFFSFQFTHT